MKDSSDVRMLNPAGPEDMTATERCCLETGINDSHFTFSLEKKGIYLTNKLLANW